MKAATPAGLLVLFSLACSGADVPTTTPPPPTTPPAVAPPPATPPPATTHRSTGGVETTYTKGDFETFHGGYGGLPDARASSSLAPQGANRYEVKNLDDDSPFTAWVEGVDGDGIGEWIEFTHASHEPAWGCGDQLTVVNGYQKSPTSFKQNSRVKSMNLMVNGTPRGRVLLEDRMGEQIIPLPVQQGDRIRLTIAEVYPGSKYKDTALTEVWVSCGP